MDKMAMLPAVILNFRQISLMKEAAQGNGPVLALLDHAMNDIATANQLFSNPPPLPSGLLEMMITDRGDHNAPHEITLPKPEPFSFGWGQHGLEGDMKTGAMNFWFVAEPDDSIKNTGQVARLVVRNPALWWLLQDGWHVNRNPITWWVYSNFRTDGNYSVFSPTFSNGEWSMPLPQGKAIHAAGHRPGVQMPVAPKAVISVMEAKLLNGTPKWGLNVGADWTAADGDAPAIAGAIMNGRFKLLGDQFETVIALASPMSDQQIRDNPPS